MSTLQYLDLSNNNFSGPIPGRIAELWNLKYLNLFNEWFRRRVSRRAVLSELINLEIVDLSDNEFSGGFSDTSGENVSGIWRFWIWGIIEVNGELPSFGSLTNLKVLRLGNNQLFGGIPEELLNGSIPNEELDLSGNGFTGYINGIHSTTLNVLNVSSNGLKGPLAHLSRSLPNLTPQFVRLRKLNLRNNSLKGNLPQLWDISTLSSVDLSLNQLNGPIPGSFFTSLTLTNLNLSGNQFSGPIPVQGSGAGELLVLPSYPLMESLDVSQNSLSGPLPSGIGNFANLKSLIFQGKIPDKLPSSLIGLNMSDNDLSGNIPQNLRNKFDITSFLPGNPSLIIPKAVDNHQILFKITLLEEGNTGQSRAQRKEFHGRSDFSGQTAMEDAKLGKSSRSSLFKFQLNAPHPPTSLSFSNNHLLTANSRSLSGQTESATDIEGSHPQVPHYLPHLVLLTCILDVYSPDRLAGELSFLDSSLAFTAEELSRAPAEVLGRSSHGTLYKATLDSGHMLTVKWLRVGLVKHKKEFAKEVKKIGSIRHPNIVPLRAYYWGPREQERLLLADYIQGDSLALHLYAAAAILSYFFLEHTLHRNNTSERHAPWKSKPANILLEGPDYITRLTDYGLHRLMTPAGIAEQILNLGALGYRAHELDNASKPAPSFKADVYAFGVILMELLTRRSAGDIISGQSGAVDLTDWVQLCDQEGRRMDCIDRDIAGGEEPTKAMDDLLAISLSVFFCK
ncbi:hypothetical protein NC653_012471 [Populus alba x Populus x berolinensis]|uniref:Protein kinase domain-containing protein n=1 Tax=Populus alba x Populus x berolinensis TaxID=444605 RepID=A0AAD6QS12_9ROSI|nr:hypothetical protein NC653_012471 [Populus alba x Populus x berolinensis]